MIQQRRNNRRMSWANAHAVADQHAMELFSICAEAQAAFLRRYNTRAQLCWPARDSMGVIHDNLV